VAHSHTVHVIVGEVGKRDLGSVRRIGDTRLVFRFEGFSSPA
jgi:hypothetical protein